MHKLTITLKQHTPLIHFQHDQEGATLRASEVKPKLDKFIIRKLKESGEYDNGVQKGWIKKKNDKEWLDYKMRIYTPSVSNRNIGEKEIIPMYFGNMSSDNIKGISYSTKSFDLKFFSPHHDLLDIIKKNKLSFFVLNNFGSRQSKGYGSFLPDDSSVADIIKSQGYFYFNYRPRYQFPISTPKEFSFLFQQIDLFYKTIRSGINQQGSYFKSMMYHYAKYQQQYWDKRAIRYNFGLFTSKKDKKELFPSSLPNKHILDLGEKTDLFNDEEKGTNSDTALLYRDILGLSTSQEWMKYGATIIKENPEIERFKSPILIKPLCDFERNRYVVFIIPLEVDKDYLGKSVNISIKYKEREPKQNETEEEKQRREALMAKRKRRNQQPMTLDIPKDFVIADYLEYIFKGEGRAIVESQIKEMSDTVNSWNKEQKRWEEKSNNIKSSLKRIYNIK